jgi:RNA polymerase sigma-70 factor, ECF subfamily
MDNSSHISGPPGHKDEGQSRRVMNEPDWLIEHFEANRKHLRAVAYRMLGSVTDADDAVQETWLRLSRSDVSDVENLRGWLPTVTARVCLNMLRSRQLRREDPLDVHIPEPIVSREDDPEQDALTADAVGLALLVVLDTLAPAERLAFVLHDMFGVPFEEIAPIMGRSSTAARQLASRARRRVRGAAVPDVDRHAQRRVVDAFLKAARGGDFQALVALLDPDVVLRVDRGDLTARPSRLIRGASEVASQALIFATRGTFARPALVNGAAGIVVIDESGRAFSVLGFIVARGRIAEIDILADPDRLSHLELSGLSG